MKHIAAVTLFVLFVPALPSAQQDRPLSPPGTATTMVGGDWVKTDAGAAAYQGGKWIEVQYSRPMLRQRTNIFGSGAEYGVGVRAGSAVWRAGANNTTVLKTEVPLVFGKTTVPAGEYGLLVDLKSATEWTLILTSQPRQPQFDANNKTDLIGATNYNPKFDVVRAPMRVDSKAPSRLDQLTISFLDVTKGGGKLAIAWENTVATVEFKVAGSSAIAEM
jgi:hypothetical protein